DKAAADGIGNLGEHDRDRTRFPQKRGHGGCRYCKDDVRLQRDQLLCEVRQSIGIAGGPAILDLHIAAVAPLQLLKPLPKRSEPTLRQRVPFAECRKNANPPHSGGLLRACRERPSCRTAEQRHELAALHSITSSAIASSVGGTAIPMALAVLRLIANSN